MKKLGLSVVFSLLVGCGGSGNPSSSTGGGAGTSTAGAAGHGGTTGTGGATGAAGATGQAGTMDQGAAGTVGSGGTTGTAGSGGSSSTAGTGGNVGSGGNSVGGSGGRGGAAGGTAGSGGATGRGGTGGGTGGSGTGGSSARFTCPSGSFTAPTASSITLTKVAGVPPFDSFNNNGNNFGNIEGPVWFGDALYVSEIGGGNNPPPSRILKVPTTGSPSVAYASSGANPGTNGMAIDEMGRLIGASHGVGGIVALNLTNMTSTTIVGMYMGSRFNSPNDLTVRSDGTIYFSDPDYQAPSPRPQSMNRLYRLPPGSTTPVVVDANRSQPNGVTLSLDEMTLYVTDSGGLYKYSVNADGSTGTATRIAMNDVTTGDGMAIDCMGNLYVASNQQMIIVNPAGSGTKIGSVTVPGVQSVTNVAFGGADHKTLYVTGQGNGSAMGVFRADMPLPGMPF
jgi:gluconolactonase